jgi:hypothetical protein
MKGKTTKPTFKNMLFTLTNFISRIKTPLVSVSLITIATFFRQILTIICSNASSKNRILLFLNKKPINISWFSVLFKQFLVLKFGMFFKVHIPKHRELRSVRNFEPPESFYISLISALPQCREFYRKSQVFIHLKRSSISVDIFNVFLFRYWNWHTSRSFYFF